ncbi:G patch domain and KOW motifs-containing protein [Trichinella pseudospiralis]|uniref:G patch domain and KOW motifs-containing protein n=2 Tax=Trichinella pseudospiralis TaxID=6337 RepID=A0A0V1J9R7_TRIPS|nr:G patch domain and KOW motifs-containing protein [Trichinella pseudospiralis]KRY78449.1 G patch domain and KOW motifs-containing protein [Trichinella pseudospiralis]KRY93532.1 G patch domain and KOW motifs-containing protein [Trichinella pseudospiralis]KRZ31711.1 G patch domain and KOW motifs-containing protein [Trichinella pseudospiralis]KRZ45033.1 G patch domain and KOW motifs-containing protein [Trichinella pseudospiralis]
MDSVGSSLSGKIQSFKFGTNLKNSKTSALSTTNVFGDEVDQDEQPDEQPKRILLFSADQDSIEDDKDSEIVIPSIPNSYFSDKTVIDDEEKKVEANVSSRLFVDQYSSENDIDYDSVPVSDYGKAILKGLGWSEGKGIGKTHQKVVAVIHSTPRPKGLGLGAVLPSVKKQKIDESGKTEDLSLKIGALVRWNSNHNGTLYGKIISMDEDNSRVMCQTALSKKTVSLSQFSITVVTAGEYAAKAKCINQSKFEEYKQKSKNDNNVNNSVHISTGVELLKNEKSQTSESQISRPRGWVYPQIRVRFVDRNFAKGKFYKLKAYVDDVVAHGCCTLVFDNGEVLENIRESQIETVIPRQEQSSVMVVCGTFRGQLGRIVHRDTRNCRVLVALAENTVELSYDDVCEYIGETED